MLKINNFNIEGKFPAVVTPEDRLFSDEEFLQALQEYKSEFAKLLLTHGALLFRGFPVGCAESFANVIRSLNFGNFVNYIGGDSPRDKVTDGVYTSTEAPPTLEIPLHQELSFIKHFPKHIYFFCEIPPVDGGETTIADARHVLENLDYDVKHRFQEKGLTYTSHYYYQSKIMDWVNRIQRSHKPWTEVFETHNKEDVELKCKENEFAWRWLYRDWLEIKQTRPALLEHPQTKDTVWFNQAHLYDFNPKLLGWKRYLGAKLFYFRKSTRFHEIKFADNSRIPQNDLYHILDVLKECTVTFPWQRGDVLILDNILAMHGRAPFKGNRRILTALTA